MGLVVSQFNNPWGSSATFDFGAAPGLQPARTDLWQLDFRTVATRMPGYLSTASGVEAAYDSYGGSAAMTQLIAAALPSPALATYMARSVTLPKRLTGVGALVRRDNAPFESPGYAANIGRVEVVFAHELASSYNGSSIWALLTVWRAFARAGYGPDYPNTPELNFGLLAAGAATGNQAGLNSPYRQPFAITLLSPMTGATDEDTSLTTGPGYVVKNAWPVEFGLETLSYENGKSILELRASFQCDDVLPETGYGIPNGNVSIGTPAVLGYGSQTGVG